MALEWVKKVDLFKGGEPWMHGRLRSDDRWIFGFYYDDIDPELNAKWYANMLSDEHALNFGDVRKFDQNMEILRVKLGLEYAA